jgi:hypothetical protein
LIQASIEFTLLINSDFYILFPNCSNLILRALKSCRISGILRVLIGASKSLVEVLMKVGQNFIAFLLELLLQHLGTEVQENNENHEIYHENHTEDCVGDQT